MKIFSDNFNFSSKHEKSYYKQFKIKVQIKYFSGCCLLNIFIFITLQIM
jgi:hypothetical protein